MKRGIYSAELRISRSENNAAFVLSAPSVHITAAEAICALGDTLDACLATWHSGQTGLTNNGGLIAGRIQGRALLKGRRYGAASNLAVHAARRAIRQAGWNPAQCDDVWLFAASSRGNAAELLGQNPWRRPSPRFSASNSMHSEIAAAISIELGLRGPWQMLANGCSAGLDALGMAWMALRSGVVKRALVVAVDLPLVPELLRDFGSTRLLSTNGVNDPLSPNTTGFHPGEAAAAVTLECHDAALPNKGWCEVAAYAANSDAYDSLMMPPGGEPLAALIQSLCVTGRPAIICPHATGTANHAAAEVSALRAAFGSAVPPLILLKPFTGHTLGASGLLDVALLAAAMRQNSYPGNLPGLTAPDAIEIPTRLSPKPQRVLKIASGMGGHNAAVILQPLAPPS